MKLGIHTQRSSYGSQGTALQCLNLSTAEISRDSLSLSPESQSFTSPSVLWGSPGLSQEIHVWACIPELGFDGFKKKFTHINKDYTEDWKDLLLCDFCMYYT